MTFIQKPTVFVSSTCYDLKQVREDIKDFIENDFGFRAMLSEFNSFPVDPCAGTFETCLAAVDSFADVFVLIVGSRYGSVRDEGKSITNLEYLHANAKSIPIYIFLSKTLNNSYNIWKNNKDKDFSSEVDNPKLFDFVEELYASQRWIFTFDSARDIKMTLKNQWASIFSSGLKYIQITSSENRIALSNNLPPEAARIIIEKPFAWEAKFLAALLKNEYDILQTSRWNYQYGFFADPVTNKNPTELNDDLADKLEEVMKLADCLTILLNTVIQDAMGDIGEPGNPEMMVYISKQFSILYQRILSWGLYFKSIHADEQYSHLLDLLYNFPASLIDSIDEFVIHFYDKIMAVPSVDDKVDRDLRFNLSLDVVNGKEISEELYRLAGRQMQYLSNPTAQS